MTDKEALQAVDMKLACEEFDELQGLLSQRADALNFLRDRFEDQPELKCTAEIFWAANKSYNAAILAEAKKIIEEATQ
ncbi:MAG: hypothetical protein IJQ01_02605 [Selenomonadaceae bacterium]|nr:hypothetical protein [Selenomonadaceae bacterium]